ncbi:MAG TPA: PepSY-associated TM helix domain-containing protein [Pseudonocardia sp.]|nr:PepSY-associated TM helix domain-containing protein [Pseudonocardia sp.]
MPDILDPPLVRAPRGAWWSDLRPLVLRLHFTVGLFVGPFLLVAALTGFAYTLTPQLEQLVHRHELTVPVGVERLPLQPQVAAAVAAVPDGTVTEIRPPRTADGTTRVSFDAPGVREGYTRTAFVDPYTAQVRGVLGTYGEWLPVRAWVDELHRTLLLGDVGRVYSELAASWLGVLVVSGLALWIVRRRRHHRLRRTLLPDGSARGRARLRSWHGAVGLWAAAGMLFLSATGLTWSQYAGAHVTELRTSLDWSAPSVDRTLPPGAADPGPPGATAERVLAAARTAGLSDPVAILPAQDRAWVVEQVQRSWPEKQDAVAVDPVSGAVLDELRFADWPLAARLARWGVDAHMGLLFGAANQVILAALALGTACLVVWGYRMWWLRRPGGTRRPSTGAVLVVGLAAIALGLLLPVLGVSLLAFLLVDAARGHVRARRVRTPR